jgi:hypothetical protein
MATAEALPELLKELKEKGFHIVHVVPASADRPKTATRPEDWLRNAGRVPWPAVVARVAPHRTVLPAPSEQIFDIGHPFGPKAAIKVSVGGQPVAAHGSEHGSDPAWPKSTETVPAAAAPELPAPSPQNIGVTIDGRAIVGESIDLRPSLNIMDTPPAPTPSLKDTHAEIVPGGWPRAVSSAR